MKNNYHIVIVGAGIVGLISAALLGKSAYNNKYHIKKLKKSQGRILIRLVDRETSRTSFALIKDFRNIFSAGFWQLTARVFGHTLLSEYDPNDGEDRIIEYIINKIENEKRKN